jgi:hypothetical protein
MQLIYETNRVQVRIFTPGDIGDAYEFMSDPEVARYEYWSPYTKKQTEKEITQLSKLSPGTLGNCGIIILIS